MEAQKQEIVQRIKELNLEPYYSVNSLHVQELRYLIDGVSYILYYAIGAGDDVLPEVEIMDGKDSYLDDSRSDYLDEKDDIYSYYASLKFGPVFRKRAKELFDDIHDLYHYLDNDYVVTSLRTMQVITGLYIKPEMVINATSLDQLKKDVVLFQLRQEFLKTETDK